jgi:hypothetical protein
LILQPWAWGKKTWVIHFKVIPPPPHAKKVFFGGGEYTESNGLRDFEHPVKNAPHLPKKITQGVFANFGHNFVFNHFIMNNFMARREMK